MGKALTKVLACVIMFRQWREGLSEGLRIRLKARTCDDGRWVGLLNLFRK